MKEQCLCGTPYILDRNIKSVNGQIVRCSACFPYPIVSESPRSRDVANRYFRIYGGRLFYRHACDEHYILNRHQQVVGRVVVGMRQGANEMRDPNQVDMVTPLDRLYSDFSEPVSGGVDDGTL